MKSLDLRSPAVWKGLKKELVTWTVVSVLSGLIQPITDTNPETPFGIVKLLQVLFVLPAGLLTAVIYTPVQNHFNPERQLGRSLVFMLLIWTISGIVVNAVIKGLGLTI